MELKKVIEDWKEDKTWIGDIINPFLEKTVCGWKNPVKEGEWLLLFSIDERTIFVDEILEVYHSQFEYHTFMLSGDEEEQRQELKRLGGELGIFTEQSKTERLKQIKEWENSGRSIKTSNPFLF